MGHRPVPDELERWEVPVLPLLVLLAGVLSALAITCASVLFSVKQNQWEIARRTGDNMVAALLGEVERSIEIYDLSLRNLVDHFYRPEIRGLTPAVRHLVLVDNAVSASHFGSIRVADRLGNLIFDSSTTGPVSGQLESMALLKIHEERADVGLLISPPSSDAAGAYEILLSRRMVDAQGSFAGVVIGSIKASYFHDLFRRLDLHEDDALTLVNRNGFVAMRRPFDIAMLGLDFSGPILRQAALSESGWFEGTGVIDPISRLHVWKRGPNFTLIYGRSLEEIFRPWLSEVFRIGWIVVALVLIVAIVTTILVLEMRLRRRMQHQLVELALADGLTGLANRRTFDRALDREWKKALRDSAQISLLMIDADNFKAFNDSHGHLAGDMALRRIAEVLVQSTDLVENCIARYGGEEFAVLLPQSDLESAFRVAETIRARVDELADCTTVSIGIATCVPCLGERSSYLIAEADEALYLAKKAGRNEVRVKAPDIAHFPVSHRDLQAQNAG